MIHEENKDGASMKKSNKEIGLYIHIPFCKEKCFYCDFNSSSNWGNHIPAYFDALKKEMLFYKDLLRDYCVKTIFIGGGTPTFVDPNYIKEIIVLIKETLCLDGLCEITLESNPGTITAYKLSVYKDAGVNRLSIGLQACQNSLLCFLGRIHTAEEFIQNYDLARRMGYDNINIDLIFAIPGQAFEDWKETLGVILKINPEHISCYSLIIEDGTAFGKRYKAGELIPAEDELDRQMYWYAVDKFTQADYKHYEISNFAKNGFKCRHNLIYWKDYEYIGFGAGSHSYFEGKRFNNLYNIQEYIDVISSGGLPSENFQIIKDGDEILEFMMLGLRLVDGVDVAEFKERFHKDPLKIFSVRLEKLTKKGLITVDNRTIKLTKLGLDLANQVFLEFI